MNGSRRLVALTAAVVLLTGCDGTATIRTAGAQVPPLVIDLAKVDSSLAHHQYAIVRATLIGLIDETRVAESDGLISQDRAGRIISAARALLKLLPRTAPRRAAPSPSPVPSISPSATATTTASTHPRHALADPDRGDDTDADSLAIADAKPESFQHAGAERDGLADSVGETCAGCGRFARSPYCGDRALRS